MEISRASFTATFLARIHAICGVTVVVISVLAGAAILSSAGAEDAALTDLVARVHADSLTASVERLVGFRTRFIGTDSSAAASEWLAGRLRGFGFHHVAFDTFLVTVDRQLSVRVDGIRVSNRYVFQDLPQWNVVARKEGLLRHGRKIVLGGHFDSISIDLDQAGQDEAPGADDNASGIAALLEIARVLADLPLEPTVEIAFFGAEELGLIGSRNFAQRAKARGDDIVAMFQLDSIGSRSALFPDALTIDTIGPYEDLAEGVAQAMEDHTSVRSRSPSGNRIYITTNGSHFSDHQSFIDAGYPGIGLLQYVDNPALHLNTSRDTLAMVDTFLATEVARGALAGLLNLAGYPARSPDFDGDGQVGETDFAALVDGFGREAREGTDGLDLDRDGWVGFGDFLLLAVNYGRDLDS